MDGLHSELALGLIGFAGGQQLQTAPFVAKTYQMVCDPRTDAFVRWGKGNNSFVIVDPAGFSQLLLPCFFKHSNFSSFVRQLNTYGFRKVHPDRWEFALESFLRGQTHLLPRIVRRRKRGEASCSAATGDAHHHSEDEADEEELLAEEVQRLRQEQAAIGDELARMSRRLQATERRPDQLMSFLARLAEDPDGVTRSLVEQAAEKKRRRMQATNAVPVVSPVPPPLPPPPPPVLGLGGVALDCDGWQWVDHQKSAAMVLPSFDPITTSSCEVQEVPDFAAGADLISINHDDAVETPFPFCLLGQGFF